MIDLHLHLDGSLTPKTIIRLAEMSGVSLPSDNEDELLKYISTDINCEDLNEYLKCFDIPLSVLQSEETLEFAAYSLCKELKGRNMIYAEIRFAPQLHTKEGLTQDKVVKAVISGIKKSGFFANVILCCMRGDKNDAENIETVNTAKRFLGKGVAAVDLAGAEGLFKTENFKNLFMLASSLGIPFTIHAGEADGAESVRCAVEYGAKRIGHGIRAIEDEELMEELKERNIFLELCPTSNIQTKAVAGIEQYPIVKFMEKGIKVTVNTDNMVVSGTDIENEFNLIKSNFNIDKKELIKNSVNAAFVSEAEKEDLFSQID